MGILLRGLQQLAFVMKKRRALLAGVASVCVLAVSGWALGAPSPQTLSTGLCPATASRALVGVYRPSRLHVLDPCTSVSGRVVAVRHKADGDVHLLLNVDPSGRRLLDRGNVAKAGGSLVVELMPRDAGRISEPQVGDHVRIVGAWTHDRAHNWNEIHPVWSLAVAGQAAQLSGPQYGGDPASTSGRAAAAACRTANGSSCAQFPKG